MARRTQTKSQNASSLEELRRQLEELKTENARLRQATSAVGADDSFPPLNATGIAALRVDLDGRIVDWTSALLTLLPLGVEHRGSLLSALTSPFADLDLHQSVRQVFEIRGEKTLLARRHISNQPYLVRISAPSRDSAGKASCLITFTDLEPVVDGLLAQEQENLRQLRLHSAELETLMRTAPVAIWIAHDPECRRITGNPKGSALLRMGHGSNLSKSAPNSEAPLHFDVYRDGVRLTPDQLPLQRCAKTGQPISDQELELRFQDGATVWEFGHVAPLFDANGRSRGAVASFLDITHLKNVEQQLKKAQAELQAHAASLEDLVAQRTLQLHEKVEHLETYSYTISHDLRGPLRAMQGFAQVLLQEHGPSLHPEARKLLDRIIRASQRMDTLTRQVLNYSKVAREEARFEDIYLDPLVHDLVGQIPVIADSNARLEIRSPLLPVFGSPVLLNQCLSNLLVNAVKFVKPGEHPRIEISTEPRDGGVLLWVRDRGIGIAPENHARIFEVFQRLNADIEGTGIGLAICKRAVDRMHGRIGVDSQLGRGAAFWIELPAASS